MTELKPNEIVVTAQRVKFHGIEYHDGYVTIEQNRTRRRVPNVEHCENNVIEIYVSTFFSHIFQHQKKPRKFVVNTVTKEWRDFVGVSVALHKPEKMDAIENNEKEQLKK